MPIDTGNTAWMLMSTALVMLMLPGLALFYGGLVRAKNVLSTIMHSFFGLAIVTVVWVIVGFSLAFAPSVGGLGIVGGLDYAFFNGVGHGAQRGVLRRERRPLRALRDVPDDVRGHHAGAHQRRLRRAQALRGLRALHDRLVAARLLAHGPHGLGRRPPLPARAPSTSRAAPSSTSRPASPRSSWPSSWASAWPAITSSRTTCP